MEDNRKKVVVPLIVGILCMFILLGGATYAYFVTNTTNSFGTKTITGQADATGSVALIGTNASLYLNLDRTLMAQSANDITYWAVETNTTPSTTQNVVTVGSTSVNGAGYFNCNYTLNVAASGTNNMYTAFQGMSGKSTEQIVLNIGGNTYDFNTASLFPITVSGTLTGVSASSVQSITAEFYLKNKSSVNQRALAGTDITLTITATSFTCTQINDPNDYLDKNWKNNLSWNHFDTTSIVFMNTVNVPEDNSGCGEIWDVSEKQNGSIIMSFDSNNCEYDDVTYYIGQNGGVLAPPNSSSLFSLVPSIDNINFQYFNTSHVTNMGGMFNNFGNLDHPITLDLTGFDTSHVTNMSGMFYYAQVVDVIMSNWNTSNVTNMAGMFEGFGMDTSRDFHLDLSSFNTANVTSMYAMFANYVGSTLDLSNFNTSNVVYMENMFWGAYNLETIYVLNDFVTTNVIDDDYIFEGCNSLVGGAGTPYSYLDFDNPDSRIYARIDNPPDARGYFTLAS